MEKHIKNYITHFDIIIDEYVPCEHCKTKQGFDFHHIINRMKARPELDEVENIILLCTKCHELAHKSKLSRGLLYTIHREKLLSKGAYNKELFDKFVREAI